MGVARRRRLVMVKDEKSWEDAETRSGLYQMSYAYLVPFFASPSAGMAMRSRFICSSNARISVYVRYRDHRSKIVSTYLWIGFKILICGLVVGLDPLPWPEPGWYHFHQFQQSAC
jgi:hypothetical protein